jgi:WD40 repeat protein
MAQVQRHRRAIAAALLGLVALAFAPALAQDSGAKDGTDLYDRPVLAIDPGMHTAEISAQAVDAAGRFAVTGSDDRAVRIWSVANGKLLRTIWIPVGPEKVGEIFAVAISPDGSTIAAGGDTERLHGPCPIYLFDRESGNLIRRVGADSPNGSAFLRFSPDGRLLAALLLGDSGLRIFDRNRDWSEVFRDDRYEMLASIAGATFAPNGRLATTTSDGWIRLYQFDPISGNPNFRRIRAVPASSGFRPRSVAFSPDGSFLAVGYHDIAAVDVLNGTTFKRVTVRVPADIQALSNGTDHVAWSPDGQTLFAVGEIMDAQFHRLVVSWDGSGLGNERRMTYCSSSSAAGIDAIPGGTVLVAAVIPCLGLADARGTPIWTEPSPILDFRDQINTLRVSENGELVDFGYLGSSGSSLRFDVKSLSLSGSPPTDGLTSGPRLDGIAVTNWRNGTTPTIGDGALLLRQPDMARSVAISPDGKHLFLGSAFALAEFDNAGTQKWRVDSRNEVWAVNASKDGRVVVSADSDGAIRWHRADDGRELLALQVLPNGKQPAEWDWVLWAPEGFYAATPGAEDVLKWVTNHGPDSAASVLPVSAIAKLHRPDALPHVLDQLETAHALGLDDILQARFDVQAKTGSAKPPGGVLHVLAIGVDRFGDKAGGLHLDYAAKDAQDVAEAILGSQRGGPGKASLYADVDLQYLSNEKAGRTAIKDALDAMAQSMAKSGSDQDVAVILVSSHGEMIDGQFYFIPYGFVGNGTQNAATDSALPASEFAKKVGALAAHGKVLLLLDACHSGAVGAQGWAKDPDGKILQDAMDLENVTVLTSSKKNELSEELPEWKHGALAEAFLDALKGAPAADGVIRLSALTDAMENEVQSLTKGRQHLGMHVNFSGDLFMASHY